MPEFVLLAAFVSSFSLGATPIANKFANSVSRSGDGHSADDSPADLAYRYIHAKSRRLRQTFIKRRFRIPEARRRARNATMTSLYRPAGGIIEAHGRAVIVCLRTLAAHLVQAPSLAMSLISPVLYKAPGIVVRATLTLVMDDLPVSKQWTIVRIERRGRRDSTRPRHA